MERPRVTRRSLALLLAIVAIAAAVRFWGLGFGLPHTEVRPDENFVILVARSFLAGNFSPQFYDYPWLYMWALSGLYLIYYVWGAATGLFHAFPDLLASWPVRWEPFYLLDRGLSAALGTATVVVVFWVGRRIWNEKVGLAAAFFLGVAFLHVRDSHFGTTDVAMAFLVMVAIALLIESYVRHGSLTAVGFVCGLAAATKYNAVLLVVPLVVAELVRLLESPHRHEGSPVERWWRPGLAFAIALLIGVPFVVLDTERFLAAMAALRQAMQLGQNRVLASAPVSGGWLYHLQVSLWHGLGAPLLVAGLAGMAAILMRTPKIGLVLFSFPLVYYAVAGNLQLLFVRYAIPIAPFLCLAAGWLVCAAADWLASLLPTRRTALWAALIAVASSLVVAAPSAASVWQFDRLIGRPDNRVVLARWVNAHVPINSSVLQSGSPYGHAQFDPTRHYALWVWDRRGRIFTVNRREATGAPDWILLQESPLPSATQEIVKDFLRRDYVLVQRFPAWSPDGSHLYDSQDAFFVPLAGFRGIERPGPNFAVFRRVDAAVE